MRPVIFQKGQIDGLRKKVLLEATYSQFLNDANEGDEIHLILQDGTDVVLNIEEIKGGRSLMLVSHDGSVLKITEGMGIAIPSNPFDPEKGTMKLILYNKETGDVINTWNLSGVEKIHLSRNGSIVTTLDGKKEDEKDDGDEEKEKEDEELPKKDKEFKISFVEELKKAKKGDRITIVTGNIIEKPESKEGDQWKEEGRIKLNVEGKLGDALYSTTIQSLEGEYKNSVIDDSDMIFIGGNSFRPPKEEENTYRLALKYEKGDEEDVHTVTNVITTFVEKGKASEPEEDEPKMDSDEYTKADIERLKNDPDFLRQVKGGMDLEQMMKKFNRARGSKKKNKKEKGSDKFKDKSTVLFKMLSSDFGDEDIELEKEDTEEGTYHKRTNEIVITTNKLKREKNKRIVLNLKKNEGDVFIANAELREGKEVVLRKEIKIKIIKYVYT